MPEFFICNPDEIAFKLKSLHQRSVSDEGWSINYYDKDKNEEWVMTKYHSEYHGGGISVLKKLPHPAVDELINIAVTSNDMNDILGASLELSDREKCNSEDFRSKLIERILQFDIANLSDFEKERLNVIIYESDLYDGTNRRNIIGKHWTEIKIDSDYYQSISQKVKGILQDIKNHK